MSWVIVSIQAEENGWGIPVFWTGKERMYFNHQFPLPETTATLNEAIQFEQEITAIVFRDSMKYPDKYRVEEWTQEKFDKFYEEGEPNDTYP